MPLPQRRAFLHLFDPIAIGPRGLLHVPPLQPFQLHQTIQAQHISNMSVTVHFYMLDYTTPVPRLADNEHQVRLCQLFRAMTC